MSTFHVLRSGLMLTATILVTGFLGYYLARTCPPIALLLLTGVARQFTFLLREGAPAR